MRQRPQRPYSVKLVIAFFAVLGSLAAQDLTNYLTPSVARVGSRLACRCGGCRMTVGNCPMIGCGSADPMRRRIYDLQARGVSDDAIVKQVVAEQGIVALSGQQPLPWIAWLMPGIALLLGFAVYTAYVRRNKKAPVPLSSSDEATLNRYRAQIDRELDDSGDPRGR